MGRNRGFMLEGERMIQLIGNTPLIDINGIYCKCEYMNPSGSGKDRVAWEMIRTIKQNKIVEASSGNTAISVAMVCSYLNKDCRVYVPRGTSPMKVKLMEAYGAEIRFSDTIQDCCNMAQKDTKQGWVYPNQFKNIKNLQAQVEMAYEIEFSPDIIVTGVGTGGTLAGLYSAFPSASYYSWYCTNGIIEGVSDGVALPLKPKQLTLTEIPVDINVVRVFQKILATKHGVFVGLSSAANYYVADMIADMIAIDYHIFKGDKTILTMFPDRGERYI